MGRPKINNKKETKSFRVDPRLWKLVQAEAKSAKSKPTDIINEALARQIAFLLHANSAMLELQIMPGLLPKRCDLSTFESDAMHLKLVCVFCVRCTCFAAFRPPLPQHRQYCIAFPH